MHLSNYVFVAILQMVPELAGDMLYFMQEEILCRRGTEDTAGPPGKSKKLRKRLPQATEVLDIPHEKLRRLARIRQLLQRRRNPQGVRKQCSSPWVQVIGGMDLQKEIQQAFPFTSRLPDTVVNCIERSPRDFMTRVTAPSADLAVVHFGLTYQQPGRSTNQQRGSIRSPNQRPDSSMSANSDSGGSGTSTNRNGFVPVVAIDAEKPPIRLLPPNYATIVGLKALLLKLPDLHSRAGNSMSRVLHMR